MTVIHGGNQKLVGKKMFKLKDADSKLFIKDMIEATKKKHYRLV